MDREKNAGKSKASKMLVCTTCAASDNAVVKINEIFVYLVAENGFSVKPFASQQAVAISRF